jgi:RNA polymerase sigma-70 factor, ECF subfamily
VHEGDEAFERFWREHFDELVRRLCAVTGEVDDADDAAQQAMLRAHEYGLARIDNPAAWLFVVGRNSYVSARRALRESVSLHEARAVPAPPLPDRDEGIDLAHARQQLSERQQTVLTLKYDIGLTSKEIAVLLGVSDGTVRATLYQCVRVLRADLGATGGRHALRGGRR